MVVVVDIRLNRYSKVYNEQEPIRGTVIISSKTDLRHDGIILSMDGHVNLQLSSKTVGIFEAFYQSVKPIQLLSYQIELGKSGKLTAGITELPFEFPLRSRNNRVLYETYHGVFINVQYSLKCEVKRSFLIGTSMSKSLEFIVEYGNNSAAPSNPSLTELITPAEMKRIDFEMVSEAGSKLGVFKAHGHIDSVVCPITKPFTGEIIIEKSEYPVKSVELQLVRVETTGCAEGYAKDASEIQTIQIGEGNVCRGLPIPIFMIFPRLFSCPTVCTTNFKIEFEANVVVILTNDFFKSENFPIKITRF
ncbi:vacuolar protein sorting-associated protein 26C isoform X2 [Folsomia candida]|uniref:vacuolar protein sorting-associated protein 26C isoform X2 n=1 Tax=Folsomia candida TaxID=158441 RepID=UPI000B8F5DAA|nr:vacuolar protein sorting-associated protein 26C isoform X2 [Folsomia candida]